MWVLDKEKKMILSCNCKHDTQDKMYGPGMRVHNPTNDTPPNWRCTVCNSVRSASKASEPKKEKKEKKD